MDIIEAAREVGRALQKDERFIRYAKARLNNDNNEDLQDAIGRFNLIRMEQDQINSAENPDEEKLHELTEEMRKVYSEIMTNPVMAEYNAARAGLDAALNDINSVISQCADGADPETVSPEVSCTGSCETCGGCH